MLQRLQTRTTAERPIPQSILLHQNPILRQIAAATSATALRIALEPFEKSAVQQLGKQKNEVYPLWLYIEQTLGGEGAKVLNEAFEWKTEDIQELLTIAVNNKDIEGVEIALARGAQPTYKLLYQAYNAQKDSTIVRLLIERGAPIDQKDNEGNDFFLRTIKDKESALSLYLLSLGKVDPNTKNFAEETALSVAYKNEDIALQKQLIRSGANIENFPAKAITQAQTELITFFLTEAADKVGAPPNEINILLLPAIKKGQKDTVSLLLKHPKCNIHQAFANGNQAMHFAAIAGDADIIRMLIEKGASIKTANEAGETPISLAKKHHPEIVGFMKETRQEKKLAPVLAPVLERVKTLGNTVAEQQKVIEAQQAKIDDLEERLAKLTPDKLAALHSLIQKEEKEMAEKEKAYQKAQEPFLRALLTGNLSVAKEWLGKGASMTKPDPSSSGFYPLLAAVNSLNPDIMKFLETSLSAEELAFQWSKFKRDRNIKDLTECKITELKDNSRAALKRWSEENKEKPSMKVYMQKCAEIEKCEWSSSPFAWVYSSYSSKPEFFNEKKLFGDRMVNPSLPTHINVVKSINNYIDELIAKIEINTKVKSNSTDTAATSQTIPVVFVSASSMSTLTAATSQTIPVVFASASSMSIDMSTTTVTVTNANATGGPTL